MRPQCGDNVYEDYSVVEDGLGGTSAGHLGQVPCLGRATKRQLPWTVSRQFLSISEDGESTTSLGKPARSAAPAEGDPRWMTPAHLRLTRGAELTQNTDTHQLHLVAPHPAALCSTRSTYI